VLLQQTWWLLLSQYLEIYEEALKALLSPKKIKSWIVLVTNSHHLELLQNLDCAAHHRIGMNRSRILVAALDKATFHLAKNDLGLLTFYHEPLVATLPSTNAADYSSRAYGAIMLVAKVHVVHLFIQLGMYDSLFQDVDIIPLRNDYHDYVRQKMLKEEADIVFQYDFFTAQQTPPEYAPWFINSGFFYVRNNVRTRRFITSLLEHVCFGFLCHFM
jgi:hypothetical protein